MTRFFFAALALTALGFTRPVAAEDCLCVGPDLFSDAFLVEASSLEPNAQGDSGEVAESPDPLAEAPSALPETPRGPILWCISPDDPRCQQDDSGEAPHRSPLASAPTAALASTPRIPSASSTSATFVNDETQPASTVRGRVDRPPRA